LETQKKGSRVGGKAASKRPLMTVNELTKLESTAERVKRETGERSNLGRRIT